MLRELRQEEQPSHDQLIGVGLSVFFAGCHHEKGPALVSRRTEK